MENPKLSKEELQELNQFEQKISDIIYSLGQVEANKAILEGQKNNLLEQLANDQEKSNILAKKLQEKYGEGQINSKTGEITR